MKPRLFSSRKGQDASDMTWMDMSFLVYAIFVGVVAILIVVVMFKNGGSFTSIPPRVPQEIYISRFLIAPNCLAYTDPSINRVYGGVMDWSRFTSPDALNSCYPGTAKDLSFELALTQQPSSAAAQTRTVHSRYYDTTRLPDARVSIPVMVHTAAGVVPGQLVVRVDS